MPYQKLEKIVQNKTPRRQDVKTPKSLLLIIVLIILCSPCIASNRNTIQIDALYWQASENGLGFALHNNTIKNPTFDWEPGFRIGYGYSFPHDRWNLSLIWTHYHAHSTVNVEAAAKPLIPTWASTDQPGNLDTAQARWRLHLGLLDLTLARCLPCSDLQLTPYCGVRYAVIRHKYFLNYVGGTLFPDGEDLIHTKNKFWGIGPRAGLNTKWMFGPHWHLFANGSLTLAFGELYVHQSEKASVGIPKRLEIHAINNQLRAMTDLAAGLGWSNTWFTARIEWDELFFFGQNQLKNFINALQSPKFIDRNDDLTLSGLTFSLYFQL
jgi:hypothetical protein